MPPAAVYGPGMTPDRRIDRPGAVLAVSDPGGTGDPVVLTHGAGLDRTTFDAQADALTDAGFRVLAWDLRGHGRSTLAEGTRVEAADLLADLDALLRACEVRAPVLVGHSLGGNLAQALARARPDRVRGVCVVDAGWNTGPLTRTERLGLRLAAPMLSLIPARSLPRLLARASATTPAAVDRAEAVFARMPKARFLEVWRAVASFIEPDPGARSPVPLALVRGAEDRTGTIATAMPRWARAEGIAEHVIEGAGHIVTWDAPERSTHALLEIFDGWGLAGAGTRPA